MVVKLDELWVKFENNALNEGLSENRIKKLRMMYRFIVVHLDLKKAKRPEIEAFVNKLNRNEIKNKKGENLAGNTKQDIKKFLRQFYKWYAGKNEFYPEQVAWVKTRIPKNETPLEKPIIELSEAKRLAQKFSKVELRILTLLLFDSGFRIQEMLSVRKCDLTWEDFDDGKKCFWIKCNKSKTFPRKIPIPLFTEDVTTYYNSAKFEGKASDSILFDISYPTYSRSLAKYSEKLFGKHITPHCLRHSSATYYAKEYVGNVPLIAQRFGWSFDARELKTYVRASGAYNRQGAKISYKNDITQLREENVKLKERLVSVENQFSSINKFMNALKNSNPEIISMLAKKVKKNTT